MKPGDKIVVVKDGRKPRDKKNRIVVTVVAYDERGLIIDDGSGNPCGYAKDQVLEQ